MGEPHGMSWTPVVGQLMTGGTVSTVVTKLVQNELLPQQSVAIQIASIVAVQPALFVNVLASETMMLDALQQLSVAVALMKFHSEPQGTVWFGPHVITGGTVSTTVMVWLQFVALPQQSLMTQLRVIATGQLPAAFVTVLTTLMMMLAAGQQASVAMGGVKTSG